LSVQGVVLCSIPISPCFGDKDPVLLRILSSLETPNLLTLTEYNNNIYLTAIGSSPGGSSMSIVTNNHLYLLFKATISSFPASNIHTEERIKNKLK
jgi:hypothetical protein